MERIPTITQGCDFTFRISARRIGYKNFVKVSFEEITNIVANLISLPSKKTPVSSSIDDAGRLIIPIDGQTLDCNMYGLELIGFYNNGNWRHQIAPAVEIVKSSAQDNYALVESDDLTIDIEITLGETTVSSRVLNTVMEEHNTSKASHQDIRQEISDLAEDQLAMAGRLDTAEQAITEHGQDIEQLKEDVQEAGNVDDVLLDGESILGQDKIARINSSGFGHVDDVKVNGQSVLDPATKSADIPVPTKVSELVNDSGFATQQEAEDMADEAKITEAEVSVDDQVGTPSATASVVGHKLTLAFQNILGDGIETIEQTTTSQESGGVNIITVTTKGGKVATFQVKNGEKGDTVILDTENQQTYTLYNSTGDNTDGALTQKAATKNFANIANADGADFFVTDDNGNVIVKSKNGHIQTKYFDSSKDATPQQRGLMSSSDKIKLDNLKSYDIEGSSVDDTSNLVFCDENGYVVLCLKNGHIKTKHFDSSQAEQTYGNKKIVFIGDSITAGVAGVTDGLYHQIIASKTGWTCVNKGVGGTGYARYISGGANFLSRYQSAIADDEDLIVIWGGTNDYGSDIADNADAPLFGSIEDPSDETTFCGAVDSLYKGLCLNYPWIPKLVITPIRRNVNPGGSTAQVQGSGDNPNKEGKTLSDYVNAIKYFAAKYMIPVLDMYEEGEMPIDADSSLVPIYTRTVGGYAGDGLHPNKTAHEKIIAPKVLQKICQIFNIR